MENLDFIVRILDGYANGTAIYFSKYNLLVTAEQFARSSPRVIIIDQYNIKSTAVVLYLNERLNIAFLKPSSSFSFSGHTIAQHHLTSNQDTHNALGYLSHFGLKSYSTSLLPLHSSIPDFDLHIHHDARLDTSCLGGPLLDTNGKMVGINTRCKFGEDLSSMALIANVLHALMEDFLRSSFKRAVICHACDQLIEDQDQKNINCPNCKTFVSLISGFEPLELPAINRKIEKILTILGYDAVLCRSDMNNWVITKGSARIHLQYNVGTGIIVAEAFLCKLLDHNRKAVLEYLLKQNYHSRGYSFSIREDIVVLSLLIYDQFINQESAIIIFNKLFQTADLYDNILIERFGAIWIDDR